MLVLSRRSQESVVVGADDDLGGMVRVTVLKIGHGRVRLGFEARKDLPVHREEVRDRTRPGGQRDPPAVGLDRSSLDDVNGEAAVLSGTGIKKSRVRKTESKAATASDSGGDSRMQVSVGTLVSAISETVRS
jgi:carbon storage regulator CsrA